MELLRQSQDNRKSNRKSQDSQIKAQQQAASPLNRISKEQLVPEEEDSDDEIIESKVIVEQSNAEALKVEEPTPTSVIQTNVQQHVNEVDASPTADALPAQAEAPAA